MCRFTQRRENRINGLLRSSQRRFKSRHGHFGNAVARHAALPRVESICGTFRTGAEKGRIPTMNKRDMSKSQIRHRVVFRRFRFIVLSAAFCSAAVKGLSYIPPVGSGTLRTVAHVVMLFVFWGANYRHCKWNFRHIHPHQRRYRYGVLAYLFFAVFSAVILLAVKRFPVYEWILGIANTFSLLYGGAGANDALISLAVFHAVSLPLIGLLPLVFQKLRRTRRRKHT